MNQHRKQKKNVKVNKTWKTECGFTVMNIVEAAEQQTKHRNLLDPNIAILYIGKPKQFMFFYPKSDKENIKCKMISLDNKIEIRKIKEQQATRPLCILYESPFLVAFLIMYFLVMWF